MPEQGIELNTAEPNYYFYDSDTDGDFNPDSSGDQSDYGTGVSGYAFYDDVIVEESVDGSAPYANQQLNNLFPNKNAVQLNRGTIILNNRSAPLDDTSILTNGSLSSLDISNIASLTPLTDAHKELIDIVYSNDGQDILDYYTGREYSTFAEANEAQAALLRDFTALMRPNYLDTMDVNFELASVAIGFEENGDVSYRISDHIVIGNSNTVSPGVLMATIKDLTPNGEGIFDLSFMHTHPDSTAGEYPLSDLTTEQAWRNDFGALTRLSFNTIGLSEGDSNMVMRGTPYVAGLPSYSQDKIRLSLSVVDVPTGTWLTESNNFVRERLPNGRLRVHSDLTSPPQEVSIGGSLTGFVPYQIRDNREGDRPTDVSSFGIHPDSNPNLHPSSGAPEALGIIGKPIYDHMRRATATSILAQHAENVTGIYDPSAPSPNELAPFEYINPVPGYEFNDGPTLGQEVPYFTNSDATGSGDAQDFDGVFDPPPSDQGADANAPGSPLGSDPDLGLVAYLESVARDVGGGPAAVSNTEIRQIDNILSVRNPVNEVTGYFDARTPSDPGAERPSALTREQSDYVDTLNNPEAQALYDEYLSATFGSWDEVTTANAEYLSKLKALHRDHQPYFDLSEEIEIGTMAVGYEFTDPQSGELVTEYKIAPHVMLGGRDAGDITGLFYSAGDIVPESGTITDLVVSHMHRDADAGSTLDEISISDILSFSGLSAEDVSITSHMQPFLRHLDPSKLSDQLSVSVSSIAAPFDAVFATTQSYQIGAPDDQGRPTVDYSGSLTPPSIVNSLRGGFLPNEAHFGVNGPQPISAFAMHPWADQSLDPAGSAPDRLMVADQDAELAVRYQFAQHLNLIPEYEDEFISTDDLGPFQYFFTPGEQRILPNRMFGDDLEQNEPADPGAQSQNGADEYPFAGGEPIILADGTVVAPSPLGDVTYDVPYTVQPGVVSGSQSGDTLIGDASSDEISVTFDDYAEIAARVGSVGLGDELGLFDGLDVSREVDFLHGVSSELGQIPEFAPFTGAFSDLYSAYNFLQNGINIFSGEPGAVDGAVSAAPGFAGALFGPEVERIVGVGTAGYNIIDAAGGFGGVELFDGLPGGLAVDNNGLFAPPTITTPL
ncbi:MAG: hypothetical protein AAGL49_03570 [Pseudomonadota bacterium]